MKKRRKKSVETGHARIPGEALREYATTNGGGYRGPGKPYQILSDLYLYYQYYLVNKWTLTQGVQIFLSKVVSHQMVSFQAWLKIQLRDNKKNDYVLPILITFL